MEEHADVLDATKSTVMPPPPPGTDATSRDRALAAFLKRADNEAIPTAANSAMVVILQLCSSLIREDKGASIDRAAPARTWPATTS